MALVLKAPCKNDAGVHRESSSVFWTRLSAACQATNASIGVCLIGGHECGVRRGRCSDFSADSSPNVRQKERFSPFPSGNAVVQKRRLYTTTLAHLPKKMKLRLSRGEPEDKRIVLEISPSRQSYFSAVGKNVLKKIEFYGDIHKYQRSTRCNETCYNSLYMYIYV